MQRTGKNNTAFPFKVVRIPAQIKKVLKEFVCYSEQALELLMKTQSCSFLFACPQCNRKLSAENLSPRAPRFILITTPAARAWSRSGVGGIWDFWTTSTLLTHRIMKAPIWALNPETYC